MNRRVSRAAIISSIVRKDFTEFSRDQLYIFLSIIGLVFFALTYYLVPDTVDETITLGVHQTGTDALVDQFQSGATTAEGLDLVALDTADHLAAAVAGDLDVYRTSTGDIVVVGAGAEPQAPKGAEKLDLTIGIAFPDRFVESTAAGGQPTVTVYTDAAVAPEIKSAMTSFVREIAYSITGDQLPVSQPAQGTAILGPDRVGDFLAAKTIYGTILTGAQALILLLALRTLTTGNWSTLLATVLLGAVMFTGIAMITGSAGKDFIGTLFYNMLFILPLMIPAFSVLFPGTAAGWVKAMPSYPIIDTLNKVTTYGAGWSEVAGSLGVALAWVVVFSVCGLLVLRRKVRTL